MDSKTAGIIASVSTALVALISVFSDQLSSLVAGNPKVAIWVSLVTTVVAAFSKSLSAPKQ